jgi:tRNA(Ile)-lysidine synthase
VTSGLVHQILEFCQKNSLLASHDHVVIGLSGGADSLCLLHVLETLRPHFDLKLTLAHLNHQLRGSESQADAAFVREVAAQRGLPVVVETRDVAAIAAKRKQSLEEAARQVRYAFLWQVATEVQANKIAVGHNADDQVETVLMHFLRGAGLAGLRGMLPVVEIASLRLHPDDIRVSSSLPSPQLIRPLLETSRSQIDAFCREQQLAPRQDTSNQDTTFFRNRLRHELIPQLETYNPNLRQTIQRTARVIAAEVELLSHQLNQAWRSVVRNESPQIIEIDLPAWQSLPLALKRSTLRRAVQRLRRHLRDVNFEHIEKARLLAETGDVGTKATLPHGLMLTMGYHTFIIAPDNIPTPLPLPDGPRFIHDQILPLNLPGVTPLPHTNWQLKADFLTAERLNHKPDDRWEEYLDADVVGSAAILRPRRPGDTFMPLGLGGHSQKVNEFMINEKIPAAWRNQIPLLVSANQILWVCGYRLDERARLRPTTQRILHLKFEQQ